MSILVEVLREGAGIAVHERDHDRRFLDLGLDSLFLTQFGVSVNRRFGTNLTFRQLATDLDTLARLAAHLEATVDASDAKAATQARETTPVDPVRADGQGDDGITRPRSPAPDSRDHGSLIRLFLSQVAVMQQQLDALRASSVEAPASREPDTSAVLLDAAHPPVPGARLGRDASGKPAWFVPKPGHPGKYVKHD